METLKLDECRDMHALVKIVNGSEEPVVVIDGEDECLVAMRPSVLERILFDGNLLNAQSLRASSW